jgi:proteic killer suppression protein
MIKSFKDKGLERFATRGDHSKLSVQNHDRVARILARLDAAQVPQDMDIPGYRFHELKGERAGAYSVQVTGNWRITFCWDGSDAVDVDLEDYH